MKRVGNLIAHKAHVPYVVLASCKIGCLIFLSLKICLGSVSKVMYCYIMEHFLFQGNKDFAADD